MYNQSLRFVHWPSTCHVDQGQHLLRFLHARPVVLEFGMQAFLLTIVLGASLPLFLSLMLIQFFFQLPDRLGIPTTTTALVKSWASDMHGYTAVPGMLL